MRRLRSALQSIRAFLLRGARPTLRGTPAVWNALTSHSALTIFGLLLLIAAFTFVGLLLWHAMRPTTFPERKEVFVLMAQGLAIIVGVSALGFTWRRIQISQEGQITERFTRAIQQLGDRKLEVRLGGIYALERIARDSPATTGPSWRSSPPSSARTPPGKVMLRLPSLPDRQIRPPRPVMLLHHRPP